MLNTSSSTTARNVGHTPHTLPATRNDGAGDTSRAVWMNALPWQSAPAGFVDFSAAMSAISPRLRTTRRLAVAGTSPLHRAVREAFEALGLLGAQQRLDEARVTQLFVSGHDSQALRALATLAEAGILNLCLRLNKAALRRQFFAGETVPDALQARTTLAALLSLKGQEPRSGNGGMSLADRLRLLAKSGHDIHGPQYPASQQGLLHALGCCSSSTAAKPHTTLMHLAARAGNLDTIKALAQAGLYIDAADHQHFTPLMRAAEAGQADAVRILLESGAKKEVAGEPDEVRATHLAAMANSGETLRALADHQADLNARARRGLTPMHMAAGLSRLDALATLVALGCDLEPVGEGSVPLTPLGMAATQGKADAIAALAGAGAPLDTPIVTGRTALHLAAIENKPESIAALHQAGARLDLPDDQGNTALHLAAALEKTRAGEALIGAGCKLNLKNHGGERPVDAAGSRSNPVMFSRLIAAGAEGPHHYVPRPPVGGI